MKKEEDKIEQNIKPVAILVKLTDNTYLKRVNNSNDRLIFEGEASEFVRRGSSFVKSRISKNSSSTVYLNYMTGIWTDSLIDSCKSVCDLLAINYNIPENKVYIFQSANDQDNYANIHDLPGGLKAVKN